MLYVKSPQRLDYTLVLGDTFQDSFTIKVNGAPYDLTGHKGRLQGKRTASDTAYTIDLTTDNGKMTFSGATGIVSYGETAANVRLWGTDSIDYQFEVEDADGNVQTLFFGTFAPVAEITE